MRKALFLLMLLSLALPAQKAWASEGGEKSHASESKKDDAKEEKSGEKKDEKKKPATHKITQSESYVMLEPFYASIMDGSRPQGLLMVGIGLDIPNAQLRERVNTEMPRLRDAYVRSLMAFAAINTRAYRQPEVTDLADKLQAVTDRYLAAKGAKVLLAQVMIRLNK
ncbi:flagellar basal body-associated protein FliL [Rhizomicrobium palustre]|uniref:Flagellar basal body-associated protein FliL n=1 Tax=Rhizomicrobium palustre TaxID=189966 RepID=A0A846MXD5_9PROT|nr:flagellar basal body-associated FliL family protein [Rhizomicrobium palustre]NIK88224.1 flagellar basal body-associated protein FliL [Rhizomicrobium palustre]